MREIKRILIANRGEIALRALRTIQEMGKGEQGFEVLKDISKTKILIKGKGVKINDLFKDSLLSYAQNPPQNPEYPKAIMVDL